MKNISSVVGWLLLAAVLAVPSFLFYNWLNKSRQQNQAELAHEPVAGSVFPGEKSVQAAGARQAVKAEAAKAAPQAGQPDKSQPPVETAAQPGRPAEPAPSASANPPAAAPRQAQGAGISTAPQQGAGQSGGAQGQVAVSTGPKLVSYFNPLSARDPTYTPDDYRRIKEEQQQREEAERQRLRDYQNRAREQGPETRISLQGIVGSAAIINGDMYSAGQTVRGVKILKIGSDYIIAEYKGRKFRKVLK
ncbi:MAG: hypothetical protein HY550_10725 [Elusimicrobia bacterium]|nr:hypothetical protein [Elusimicrobiota bacterium]